MILALPGCESDVEKCVDSLIAMRTQENQKIPDSKTDRKKTFTWEDARRPPTAEKLTKSEIEAESRVYCLRAAAGK